MGTLSGRSVVVTGAGRGLGLAMAHRIGALGATVHVAELREDWGEQAVAELTAAGVDARFVQVDVADPASVERMAEAVTAAGPVYGLVNNAALADAVGGKRFHEIEVADWDRIMTVNARGPWLVSRAIVPSMIAAGEGRVVNISSDSVLYGSPRLAHYITSKGAVMALSLAMAREVGEHGITVNTVAPGLTEGDSTDRIPADRHELYNSNRAIPRPQVPDDMTGLVAFLLGPEAGYITGQLMVVDGGWVMH